MAYTVRIRTSLPLLFVVFFCLTCAPTEQHVAADAVVSCDSLTASLSSDKNFYILTATTSGDTTAITGYTFAYGDHQSYTIAFNSAARDHHTASVTHAYQAPGVYTASVKVSTKVNRQTSTVTSPSCQTTISVGQAASTLPNTGDGNIFQLFALTSVFGIAFYELLIRYQVHMKKTTVSR